MGIFSTTLGLRRLLVELRGLRRAVERLADCAELQAQTAQRPNQGKVFRSFSREKVPSDGEGSSVSYVDPKEQSELLARAEELRSLLGRDPSDEELERAWRGDVE
jgi:hypothetical protein